ncbi:group 1 glycosyl transferase [Caballeronia calidae]|uniref:Group 1 glycosyl transferase n=1 Tax=Caballeronia calidae TaxID=1777139 RepID=A0A158EC63_9BURK|nr:glycosyltransferase [Caballeronia calidae]SAL04501.1 group 1 glycosyl transferase [Caballeronia calidae]
MDLSGFFDFDESIRVWVERERKPFDYSDGEEQEQYLLDAVRGAIDVSSGSMELREKMIDWPSTYHLTPRRGNLLRPFASWFAGKRVLEIGCGCGAITRFLGESGATVVSVEGSLMRATIARERCRDLPNVEIICATSEKIGVLGEFDAVMLIGVLEYARKFLGENGTHQLLSDCVARLTEAGRLFVAIENQLGLKYFAGAAEDHTGVPMFGLEERYSPEGVATFGREELGSHLDRASLSFQQWWYPFPDYKLPLSVLSEDAVRGRLDADFSPMISNASAADPQRPFYQSFSLERAWGPVYRNGLAHALSNSFLAIASRQPLMGGDPDAVGFHYAVDRLPQFTKELQISKTAHGPLMVTHRPLFASADTRFTGVENLPVADAPFIGGTHWQHRLSLLLSEPGWTRTTFIEWYMQWLEAVKPQLGIASDGVLPALDSPVDGRLVDALPRNLILDGGRASFFDLEWKYGETIDFGYLLFRGAYCSLWELRPVAVPEEGTAVRLRDLFAVALKHIGFSLSDETLERYCELEREFQRSTTGRSALDSNAVLKAELIVTPSIVNEVIRLNGYALEKEGAISAQGAEIHRLEAVLVEKETMVGALSAEVQALNERIVAETGAKDEIIHRLGEEIHGLNVRLENEVEQAKKLSEGRVQRERDAEEALVSEELVWQRKQAEAQANLIKMQAERIRRLERDQLREPVKSFDASVASVETEAAQLREAFAALRQTKWFRLRDALTQRPMSARQMARAGYLIGAMATPAALKRPLSRVVSQARALVSPPPEPPTPRLPKAPVAPKGEGANAYIVRQKKPDLAERPRVLHVIANFMTGGSSKLVVDLIEGLGHRYRQTVLTSFIPTPQAYTGVDIHEISQPGEPDQFLAFFRTHRPDFIHVHYWGDCDEPWYAKAFAAAAELGIPVVQNVNTPVAPFVSPSIVHNVYVSKYVEREFGDPRANNRVIYPGSDFSHFTLKDGEKPVGTMVGMVYRLEGDKLNENAIVPFIRVAQMNRKARILIVGGGSLLEPFKASVAAAGVDAQFEFTGYVGYGELPGLYRRMAVFVAPVWKESFGQVSPFAMNMEVPVVGYDVGAIGEIINDDRYLAPAADAERLAQIIDSLLHDDAARRNLALNHRNRAQQHFSLEAMVSSYRFLYGDVLGADVTKHPD